MLAHRQGRSRTRIVALVGALAVSAALLVDPTTAAANPPPNPSDSQINHAKHAKEQLATEVGQLSGQIARLQTEITHLDQNAELAEQKLALAMQKLQQAKDAAAAARKKVKAAQQAVTAAQHDFDSFARASYMGSPVDALAGGLLTATNPNTVLERGDYLRYSANHQLDAIGQLNRATIAKSNADAAARLAVQKQNAAAAAAKKAKQAADDALAAARQKKGELNSELASNQKKLDAAKSKLATLNNQRKQYLAWKKKQEEIARARALARARAAAAAAAARAAQQRAAAQAAAQQAAAGGGGGGSVQAPVVAAASVPIAPTSGWSQAAANTAVARAMAYLGWPYSFAAGNYDGPTYGVAVDFDSRNDGGVFGFDCSGLTLYAWAPYIHMDHYAATQYTQAGSFHPAISQLLPGDLVFWSSDGTIPGIGHVAMYIGNGNVIQAPFSGAYLEVTPLGQVESGYYGATRPLT